MNDRELMQQALDALEYASDETKPEGLYGCECLICKTILALRESLAQPERPWVGLADEEVAELAAYVYAGDPQYVRLIEAKLKEKNT